MTPDQLLKMFAESRSKSADHPLPHFEDWAKQLRPATADSLLTTIAYHQDLTLQNGEIRPAEAYLADCSSFETDCDFVVEVVYQEWVKRQLAGETCSKRDYITRFPQFEHGLTRQWAIGEFIYPELLDDEATSSRDDTVASEVPPVNQGEPAAAGVTNGLAATTGPPAINSERYELLRQLGRGGMGTVYLARDKDLDREVALKVPKINGTDEPEFMERFQREARAAASLRHPNICQVHDVNVYDGTPYITMTFVDGVPLSDSSVSERLTSIEDIVRIIRIIADAMEHAHASGVIHRDLKPGNILVDAELQPYITDFGLARKIQQPVESRLTDEGRLLGTPAYMPPEQVQGYQNNIGPHSDVYALGVILFELLTGRLPFEGSVPEILAQILRDPPPSPVSLREDIPDRLNDLCLRMMEKEPSSRFRTMAEVSGELQVIREEGDKSSQAATLQSEQSRSRPIQRGLAVSFGLLIVSGFAFFMRPDRQSVLPVTRTDRNETSRHMVVEASKSPPLITAIAEITNDVIHRTPLPDGPPGLVRELKGHTGAIVDISFSPDGRTVATASHDQTVRFWDLDTGTEMRRADPDSSRHVNAMQFDKSGVYLYAGSTFAPRPKVRRLDAASGGNVRGYGDVNSLVLDLDVSRDGRRLAAIYRDGNVIVWNAETGAAIASISVGNDIIGASVRLVDDGQSLIVASGGDYGTRLFDVATMDEIIVYEQDEGDVRKLAVSRDENLIAVSNGSYFKCLDRESGGLKFTLRTESYSCESEFLSGGRYLAVADAYSLKTINTSDGTIAERIDAGTNRFSQVAVSPDGRFAVTGGGANWDKSKGTFVGNGDYSVYVWRLPKESWPTGTVNDIEARLNSTEDPSSVSSHSLHPVVPPGLRGQLEGHTAPVISLEFSPDGKTLVSSGEDRTVRFWDVESQVEIRQCAESESIWIRDTVFASDGEFLVTGRTLGPPPKVRLVDPQSAIVRKSFYSNNARDRVLCVDVSPDRNRIAAISSMHKKIDVTARVWNTATGEVESEIPCGTEESMIALRFVANHLLLLSTANPEFGTQLWDLDTGTLVRQYAKSASKLRCIPFCDQNQTFSTSHPPESIVSIFHLDADACQKTIRHGECTDCTFSPNGSHLIVSKYKSLKILDVVTGGTVDYKTSETARFDKIALTPDGRLLATAGGGVWNDEHRRVDGDGDYMIYLWEMPPMLHVRD